MEFVDLSSFDGGLVGIIREIILIGEKEVKLDNLTERGYSTKGVSTMMMKNYQTDSVCYIKDKETKLYELFAIAKIYQK